MLIRIRITMMNKLMNEVKKKDVLKLENGGFNLFYFLNSNVPKKYE